MREQTFQEGDHALVLWPLPGSSLQARFSSPCRIQEKVNPTDYVIETPNCKQKTHVYVNMLKPYADHSDSVPLFAPIPLPAAVVSVAIQIQKLDFYPYSQTPL